MTGPQQSVIDLEKSTERLRARNDQLAAHLQGKNSIVERVANSPEVSLEDATERARKFWDAQEKRRGSVPPKR